jgi:anti-anti-sigma factor
VSVRRRASAPAVEVEVRPPSTCRIVSESHVGATVFRLQGEIDTTTAHEVRTFLAAAIGETAVILDLTEVTSVDMAGVAALRDVMECIYDQGGRTGIARPWRARHSALGLVGTLGFVILAVSQSGALTWFADPNNSAEPAFDRGSIHA